MSARVIRVIETTNATRGKGTPDSPIRTLRQYYSEDGELLAEVDSWREELDAEALARSVSDLLYHLQELKIGGNLDGMIDGIRRILRRGHT